MHIITGDENTSTTVDLLALGEKLTTIQQDEQRKQEALTKLNTEDPQRDKFWRTLGKKIRHDAKQTPRR